MIFFRPRSKTSRSFICKECKQTWRGVFEIQRIILLTHLETILAIVLLRNSPNVLKATLEFLYYRRSCFQESTHTTSEKREEENPTVGFLVLYSLFQGSGFRIPHAKISRIPESGFPYIGRFLRILQVF